MVYRASGEPQRIIFPEVKNIRIHAFGLRLPKYQPIANAAAMSKINSIIGPLLFRTLLDFV